MDYEATLNQALDLLADGEDRKAERLLQGIIDHLKPRLTGSDADLEQYYFWGRALTAMDEPEQALLKFEKALAIDPSHEPSLWETASIFLHDLDRPESAVALLKEKLLPASPGNAMYAESLKAAEFALRLKKSPPPAGGKAPDAEGKAAGGEGPAARSEAKRKADSARRDREAALQAEADALLEEAGWTPDDELPGEPPAR
jgi:tetratricopeptide (TPR) repeat protein